MDVYNTIAICLHEIRVVTVFIHRTIRSAKKYEKTRATLQVKLEHEIAFIEAFLDIYFEGLNPLFAQAEVRDNLRQDVGRILQGLRKLLAEYREDATRARIILREDFLLPYTDDPGSQAGPQANNVLQKSLRDLVAEKVEGRVEKLRDKTPPKVDWALYTEAKINHLLAEYRNWTLLLREDLALLGTLGIRPDPSRTQVADLRLETWFLKQLKLTREPPSEFGPLAGDLTDLNASDLERSFSSAVHEDQLGLGQERVLVEAKTYPDKLRELVEAEDSSSSEEIEALKAPMRQLAWMLHSAADEWQRDREQDESSGPAAQLSCKGFIDEPQNRRALLLYRLPSGPDSSRAITTLLDALQPSSSSSTSSSSDAPRHNKPPLGARFKIAHRLASALFGVFASGWLHKNMSSRAVLVDGAHGVFLIGWGGGARRREDETALQACNAAQLEPNLYRHPARYGRPQRAAAHEHDIYGLGVVLLEVGLWEPVARRFARHIRDAARAGALPPARAVFNALVKLARDDKVHQEMGSAYSRLVERCLMSDFGVDDDEEPHTKLALAFRSHVVDALAKGCAL